VSRIAIIVLDGNYLNQTLASINFGYYGELTPHQEIIICSSWSDGYCEAVEKQYSYGLFIKAGTVFYDFKEFCKSIKTYPHKGLVGHLTDPLNEQEYYYLHDQCFYLDLSLVQENDFDISDFEGKNVVRSQNNIHHDYTPLVLQEKAGSKYIQGKRFGEKIISSVIEKAGVAVNFNNKIRGLKHFIYDAEQLQKWMEFNRSYLELAENQLWIFNNEPWAVSEESVITTPASGQFWMFSAIAHNIQTINLVDISKMQITYAQELWNYWDGENLGLFVFNFIKKHNVRHYNLGELRVRSKEESIRLMKQEYFVNFVNAKFTEVLAQYQIEDFGTIWKHAKSKIHISFNNDNLVKWIAHNKPSGYVWGSNVDTYKYTLLTTTREELNEFKKSINQNGCQ